MPKCIAAAKPCNVVARNQTGQIVGALLSEDLYQPKDKTEQQTVTQNSGPNSDGKDDGIGATVA